MRNINWSTNVVIPFLVGALVAALILILTSCIKLPSEIVLKHCVIEGGGIIGAATDSVPCASVDSIIP